MRSHAPNQHNCDLVAHFGFYPVRIAFYVENHAVVAQKAGRWIPCLNVGRPGPVSFLNLENPRAEGTPDVGMILRELCQQLFAN